MRLRQACVAVPKKLYLITLLGVTLNGIAPYYAPFFLIQ